MISLLSSALNTRSLLSRFFLCFVYEIEMNSSRLVRLSSLAVESVVYWTKERTKVEVALYKGGYVTAAKPDKCAETSEIVYEIDLADDLADLRSPAERRDQ